jgi:hypothetical protein
LVIESYIWWRFWFSVWRRWHVLVVFFPEYPLGFNYAVRKFIPAAGYRVRPFNVHSFFEAVEHPLVRVLLKPFLRRPVRVVCFVFEDKSVSTLSVREFLRGYDHPLRAHAFINASCWDIRKTRVGEAMRAVFGYDAAVDPLEHRGPMVVKSNLNGFHDGRVITGPVPRERILATAVYQKVIDNVVDQVWVEDLRAVIMGSSIVLVYRKIRPLSDRFSNANYRVTLVSPDTAFSREEQGRLVEVAKTMGLDICELDVLRDRRERRLYVVDVNRTVSGPPNGLPLTATLRAIGLMADGFAAYMDALEPMAPAPVSCVEEPSTGRSK